MAITTRYDRTHLTDKAKVKRLATWVLTDTNYFATAARNTLGVAQQMGNPPPDALLKRVYGHLFDPDTDVAGLIRAYRG
jgi:hypothetical protein